uniref:LD20259p n=1 Tax=Drosophila melanogaster TaxID=7227 RepID=Q6NL55_DROME|nr:LD20259p [Drosophila melanogaster]
MRNKFQSAIRGVTRQYIIRSWPRGRELLRTQLIIPPSSTSSPFTCRNYSKFSTHLSMERALELLCNLDDEERGNLRSALGRLDADKEKNYTRVNWLSVVGALASDDFLIRRNWAKLLRELFAQCPMIGCEKNWVNNDISH